MSFNIPQNDPYFINLLTFYNSLPGSLSWKDMNGFYIWSNPAFLKDIDSNQSIIGKNDKELWPEEYLSLIVNDKKVLSTDSTHSFEETFSVNNKKQHFITIKSPLKDANHQTIGIIINLIALNKVENYHPFSAEEVKIFEKNSKLSDHHLRNIIESVPGSIYWKNRDGVWIGCNNYTLKTTGISSPEDLLGKTDDELWPAYAKELRENDLKVMSTGCTLSREESVILPNGKKRYFAAEKMPLRDFDNNIIGVIGNSIDITELKETQEKLAKAKEAAEAGERAKTEFIANISHDIRTPLAGVVGLGGILEKTLHNPENKHMAHDLVQSANQLLNMLNEILDVISADNISTKDVHEEPFDLKLLIQNMVDLERSSVDFKKIRFLTDVDEAIPHILVGDHKKIHHILLNLVGNSIKFTSEGHVAIHLKILEKHADKIQLQFKITDTGKGIPQEALDKIFDAFYRVTPSYKGLDKGHGLGLHIAQSYTRLLGGDIAVESKVNEGSQFSFSLCFKIADNDAIPKNLPRETLALTVEEDDCDTDRNTPDNTPLLNAPNILIIEDNHVARTVVKTLFKDANCNPITASDGQSGLELAKNGEFDLIISDVGLPDISGLDITRQLRLYEKEQGKRPIPIVGLTAHAGGKTHIECLEAGMNDVVIKPIKTEMIKDICNKFSLFEKTPNLPPAVVDTVTTPPSRPAHPLVLGEDLPGSEAALFAIEQLLLFDLEKARKILGNNNALLMDMLKTTIHSLIPEELALMKQAHEAGNWQTVSRIAHKLKGGFLSIGLTRAAVACQYLERYYKAGHSELLEKLYEQMLQTLAATSDNIQSFTK